MPSAAGALPQQERRTATFALCRVPCRRPPRGGMDGCTFSVKQQTYRGETLFSFMYQFNSISRPPGLGVTGSGHLKQAREWAPRAGPGIPSGRVEKFFRPPRRPPVVRVHGAGPIWPPPVEESGERAYHCDDATRLHRQPALSGRATIRAARTYRGPQRARGPSAPARMPFGRTSRKGASDFAPGGLKPWNELRYGVT